MRAALPLLALLILAIGAGSATADDPAVEHPGAVNKLLQEFQTPTIAPGDSAIFSFAIHNPYANVMRDLTLVAEIYQYATIEGNRSIAELSDPPVIAESGSQELTFTAPLIGYNASLPVQFTIETTKRTPHGSFFSQSTYFVRFTLNFTYEGVSYDMISRGHISSADWTRLSNTTNAPEVRGRLNATYLEEVLGADGLLPDSAFGMRAPLPLWPFWLLVGLAVFFGMLALMFWLEENPGTWPWLEERFEQLRGKAYQLRSRLEQWRRK